MSELTGITLQGAGTNPEVKCLDKEARKSTETSVMKTFADGSRAVFCRDVPKSGAEWQNILRKAGSHIYTAPGSYFRKHGNVFMFHTGTRGTHRISLRENAGSVTELFTNQTLMADNIVLKTDGPATWLFQMN
jgi:hypothetical protein